MDSNRLIEFARKHAGNRERIVRVRILFVEPHRFQCRVDAFAKIRSFILAPAVRRDSRADAAEPCMRLGKLRIDLARFTEELTCSKMCRLRDLMKEPGALVHEIPPRHVTHTAPACNGKRRFAFQQLGLDRPHHLFGDSILHREKLAELEIVPISP